MKQSHLLTKTRKTISDQEASINAQLLERGGYVSKLMAGVYSFLPLGYKVLKNIEAIVREEMDALGAQEIFMPGLHPRENWDTTGRWNTVDVLYKIKVGDRDYCLGPTHEEIVTPLVAPYIQSYKDLPRAVYQIQTKFRSEARPKSGLLRGREFRMKDLYSFHSDQQDLDTYYDNALEVYKRIFERIGLGDRTYMTYASGGTFSKYSHEFQTVTPTGEDTIFLCKNCKIAVNHEISAEQKSCPQCNNTNLEEQKSIEVGNIFKLQSKFSEPFNFTFTDAQGTSQPVLMGCYGIGTSRLVGAIVEILHDEKGILWPAAVAPYDVHLISLVRDAADKERVEAIYKDLQAAGVEVLYDDRSDISAGEKFADADLLGMPWRFVVSGKTLGQNAIEVKARSSKEIEMLSLNDLEERSKSFKRN